MSAVTYPVRVDASLDRHLSRWLWLVKWVLAIPHYIILSFLWMAFVVLSAVAFFAILFTGRYPQSIFEFNVGVLRWTWRVQYYAYGALGTDRYPPFTLEDVPDYPAHLEIDYPERLSRGLVLVKWWLLAIPQYIIVGLFAGGGTFAAWRLGSGNFHWAGGGLIGILVLVAAIILAFTGRYPDAIFDFVLGMNRWVLRVAAYAGLMTDKYPPFRLDVGGHETGGTLIFQAAPVPSAVTDAVGSQAAVAGSAAVLPGSQYGTGGPAPRPPAGRGWTAGRVVSAVIGSVLVLASVGLLSGGAGLVWAGSTHRVNGYVTSGSATYSTGGYALATDTVQLPAGVWDWFGKGLVGNVRIRVTSSDPAKPVFIGIAPASDVSSYLSGVRYTTLTNLGGGNGQISHQGSAVPAPPASSTIWTLHATGPGTQTLVWTAPAGDWVIVAMNANASPGLTVSADAGASMPGLGWIAGGLLAGGLLILVGGILLIAIPIRRAS
ncbi:MAG TPA: DUF4389 domain-containing protein [Streptosporangiaceae bacterium]|nr:DUF4389 domain-containing protein [Streptosporangiaceae bacterium]